MPTNKRDDVSHKWSEEAQDRYREMTVKKAKILLRMRVNLGNPVEIAMARLIEDMGARINELERRIRIL